MDMNAILRRVQKLFAIANDGRGDPNEAAAAAAQAENIMRKFQIENADAMRTVTIFYSVRSVGTKWFYSKNAAGEPIGLVPPGHPGAAPAVYRAKVAHELVRLMGRIGIHCELVKPKE